MPTGGRDLIRDGKTGELFCSGDAEDLKNKIRALWYHEERTNKYRENCLEVNFDTVEDYAEKLMPIYKN